MKIYTIFNTTNRKMYVGSTINLKKRWYNHKRELNKNIHKNQYLQNSWNKHGEDSFVFMVVENIKQGDDILKREAYWINKFDSFNNGYNLVEDPSTGDPKALYEIDPKTMTITREIPHIIDNHMRHVAHNYSTTQSSNNYYTKDGLIYCYQEDYDKKRIVKIYSSKKNGSKIVYQFTKEDILIKQYKSCTEAAESIYTDQSKLTHVIKRISACCRGEKKTYKGFKWSYNNTI